MIFSSSKITNSSLPETESTNVLILNNIDAIIYVVDINSHELLFINQYAKKYFNSTDEKICWQALHPSQTTPCSYCTKDQLLDSKGKPGPPVQWEYTDPVIGTILSVQDRAIPWQNNRFAKLTLATDITGKRKTEDVLHKTIVNAKKEWEEVFDIINDAITIHDDKFNIIRANRAAEELLDTNLHNILKRKCYESYHGTNCPPEGCPSCESYKTGKPSVSKIYEPNIKKHIEIKALPRCNKNDEIVGLVHIVRDITTQELEKEKRKKLQKQLSRSQKLEAIGQLAGGVAHDFNNLLTGILGFTGLAMDQIDDKEPLHEDLLEIKTLAKRAATLTRQLLTFSQRQSSDPVELNINDLIENLAKMLRRLLGKDVELILNLSKKPLHIVADPGQIEQIVANLSVNSRQAMPSGGTLIIKTKNTQLIGMESFFAAPEIIAGNYAQIEISDTGCGMDESVKEQIFEPFFTTKEIGQGSGLGMSIIYGIVHEHNGYIKVLSNPGAGTTISILLPQAPTEDTLKESSSYKEDTPSGSETILLVDDDDHIRRLLERILDKLGYQVLSASGYVDAEKLMNNNSDKIDMLLVDVIMPNKSGKDVFDNLRTIKPDLKVIFMSGFTADSKIIRQVMQSSHPFIEKPISFTKLADTIRSVLKK